MKKESKRIPLSTYMEPRHKNWLTKEAKKREMFVWELLEEFVTRAKSESRKAA